MRLQHDCLLRFDLRGDKITQLVRLETLLDKYVIIHCQLERLSIAIMNYIHDQDYLPFSVRKQLL